MGRPKAPAKRSQQVNVRFSDEEYERLLAIAEAQHLTISDVVRRAALGVDAELVARIAFNQAKAVHDLVWAQLGGKGLPEVPGAEQFERLVAAVPDVALPSEPVLSDAGLIDEIEAAVNRPASGEPKRKAGVRAGGRESG